jgi:hypothetical protein
MAVYHRTQRLQIYGEKPEVTKLFGDRYRMVVRCKAARDTEAWYNANKDQIFASFGTLYSAQMSVDGIDPRTGEAYPDMCLVSNSASYTQTGEYIINFVYETLTATWTKEQDDEVTSTDNGLRVLERSEVAAIDTAAPYDEDDVGVVTITDAGKTLYLASFQDQTGAESNAQVGRVVTRWAEAGILSRTEDFVGSQDSLVIEAIGPDPSTPLGFILASKQESNYEGFQTNRFTFLKPSVLSRNIQTRNNGKLIIETVEAFNEVPTANTVGAVQIGDEVSDVEGIPTRRYTFAKGSGQISVSKRPAESSLAGCTYVTVRSFGTPVTPTGVLVAESETESDGYITYEKTAIQGTITGEKQTYLDVVDVEVPGTVQCTTVSVSSGGVSGTLAVPLVTPRRNKKVSATVTVEITTSPPNTASLAYDLGQISCSVTTTNVSLSVGPGSTVTVGTNAVVSDTGYVQNFGASANIGVYPGCYLTAGGSNGTVSYITSSQPVASGNTIYRQEASSSRNTSCTGTGSSSAEGYSETGIISRKSRPILTTLDGTTYYEVVTWSV